MPIDKKCAAGQSAYLFIRVIRPDYPHIAKLQNLVVFSL